MYDFDADDYSTTADLTAGQQLDISGWIVGSGTWAITNVLGKKWIKSRSATANQFSYCQIDQNSYGTWIFTVYKSIANECIFTINDRIGIPTNTAGSNGYWIHFNVNNFISLNVAVNGVSTALMRTNNSYLSITTQYRICMTRDNNGNSSLYVIGGSFTSWTLIVVTSGTNPVINKQVNPTQYLGVRGDNVGTRFSDIIHLEQVINPLITPELIPNI